MPEQPKSIKEKIQGYLKLGRVLRFVWQSAKGWTIVNGVLSMVQGVFPLIQLYLMKLMVDTLVKGAAVSDRGVVFRHVLLLVGLMGVVTLFTCLIRSIAGLVSAWHSYLVTDNMSDALIAKSIEVGLINLF